MADLGVEVDEFTQARLLRGDYDVWHLHWPDGLLSKPRAGLVAAKVGVLMALLEAARMRGIKRVWTIHNLQSHEGFHPAIERRFWSGLLKRLDGYISLSEAVRTAALGRFPLLGSLPGFVIPPGSFRGLYPDQVTREQARNRLRLPNDATVLAHVGQIRQYKNVSHLIRTFRSISGEKAAVLLVAGRPHPASLAQDVQTAAAHDRRVRLSLDFVPDEQIQFYLRSADLVVLPYSEIANSGSAMLSLSFDRPMLVPRQGAMPELQQRVGENWIRLYDGELTPHVLIDAIEWAADTPRPTKAPLDEFAWPHLARQTVDAYRQICSGP